MKQIKLCLIFVLLTISPAIAGDNNWPSFRGDHASGVADGQNLPDTWNVETGENIKWKAKVPGLSHASPIIWGEKLFITTAISSGGDDSFKHGLYGDGAASDDSSMQKWAVYCFNKKSGELLWEENAVEATPIDKRHIKATYNNSTPATNGEIVVAFFGSQGVYAYTVEGKFLWKKDLGRLDVGAYDAPDYEWGSASSPIIYKEMVILQCDTQQESFVIACDIKSGKTIWRTDRDELPSWGTPTIFPGKNRAELITNSSNFIYGYNPETGKELWRLGGSSQITAPTPIFKDDIIIITNGRRPEKPIFALRPGATGDITLKNGETSNEFVIWSKLKRGTYMPTPVIYGDYLYTLNNNGVFDCYKLATGKEIYRQRILHHGGGFSASPVVADKKLYLPAEDGQIFVVKCGAEYQLLSSNETGELLMATPAISGGILYIRGQNHLFAIGR